MRFAHLCCACGAALALLGAPAHAQMPMAYPAHYGYPAQAGYPTAPAPVAQPVYYPGQAWAFAPWPATYQPVAWTYPQGQQVASGWGHRSAAPCCPQPVMPEAHMPVQPVQPVQPKQADQVKQPDQPMAQAPETDAFAQAPDAGTEAPTQFNPQMIGDLGFGAAVSVGNSSGTVQVPIASRGAFKVAENESPRPTDRVFLTYNYFNGVFDNVNNGALGSTDLHREVLGFEKTFLNGNASFGVRVPFFQLLADAPFSLKDLGDITFVLKYAVINNLETGNVLSGGVVVTAPTGPSITLGDGSELNTTILQPWVGFIWNADRLYFHGFSACALPTDTDKDVTLLFNDFGVGYRIQRCGSFVTGVVPTLELHVTTPLNHRGFETAGAVGAAGDVRGIDQLVITGGSHIEMGRCVLTLGAATPVTGPRLYSVEGIAQVNFRW